MDDKVIVDLLGHVGNLFTSSLELKETIDFMLKAAADLVPCDTATVFLTDPDAGRLNAIATYPFTHDVEQVASFKIGEGIVGWAAQKRKMVSVEDATKDLRFKKLNLAYSPRSCLVMPLESPRRLVGALTVARRKVKPFNNIEQALIQIIANQAAISIDNSRLYNSQREQLAEIALQKRELEIANVQIAEISRLKSEFLANMSHELRTPLNAILGFSEIMKDNLAGELSPQQQQECLENIHASGKHLLELVNDVLDLSKIEAGRMELAYEHFTVQAAFNEVHNVVRSLSQRSGLKITPDIVPQDLQIRADKSKFKQVLYNLFSNAIKFTPSGGSISLKAYRQDDELVVEVTDTGIGIPQEDQDRIFTEFYQAHNQRANEAEGTGLGLSLTQRIIELHRGHISVRSEEGKGTTFILRLPIRGADISEPERKVRILLVEDNTANRDLAKMVLSGNGFEVDIAIDGEQGLHKARSNTYDLVLMDVNLPDIDGLAVTRMLKADPTTATLPIVALTANAMKGDEQDAYAAGCTGYISKPFDVAELVKQISSIMEADSV